VGQDDERGKMTIGC